MIEKKLKTWEAFEEEMRSLRELHNEKKFLFRGQSNSGWQLETTLERYIRKEISLSTYYGLAFAAKNKVETFTKKKWDKIPIPPSFSNKLKDIHPKLLKDIIEYEYLAFLRHHGYPSPLLDWTASAYIAAFFAMRDVSETSDCVSIYAYLESARKYKIESPYQEPIIQTMGPYITSHKRHFLQQSDYTICTEIRNKEIYYTCHEKVTSVNDKEQDLLWKFNIPATERIKVLRLLNMMNINAFSLFGTDDSLVETIAVSEILLNKAL